MLGEEAEGWNGKHERSEGLHKRSAEDCGKPLAPRQGRALSEVWFPYSRANSTQKLSGSRCGRNRPQEGAEDAQRLERGRRLPPSLRWFQAK
jgi:hypothetical protein